MAKIMMLTEDINSENKVLKSRKKNLGNVPADSAKNIFAESMKELADKYKMACLAKMQLFNVVEQTEDKCVMLIQSCLVFECDRRITYYIA